MTALVTRAKTHAFKLEVAVLALLTTFLLTTAVAKLIIIFGS